MKKITIQILTVIVFFCLGLLARPYLLMTQNKSLNKSIITKAKIKYWVAPMDPKFRKDKPGKSPMGMDLVPVYESTQKIPNDKSIKISPRLVNNMGVATYKAKFQKLSKQINTVGYVTSNEDLIENVHSYIDGWVRNLKVNAVGETVTKGQVLFELFSPSLVNAQQELLLALKSNNNSLVSSGRKKLLTLGLNEQQIKKIIKNKTVQKQIAILAKTSGIVSKLNIRDGMYIKPTLMLMVIEDLSSIWIQVEVYEKEANWPALGQTAIAEFPGLPGRQWQGEVVYVYPTLNKTTHTLAVRLKFPNPNLILKPNMYASVKIFVPNDKKFLVIPSSAIIQKANGAYVMLALGKGLFRPQMVTLGDSAGEKTSIISGLKNGALVVTSGQFLIDSESELSAAFDRFASINPISDVDLSKKSSQLYTGKILAIDINNKIITLSHKSIKKLAMPMMVMEADVAKDLNLNDFKVGQFINFKLKKLKNNKYQIIKMSHQDPAGRK